MSQPLRHLGPHYGFGPCGTRPHERKSDYFPTHKESDSLFRDYEVPLSSVYKDALRDRPSIQIDSEILGGRPHIVGTRIPVFMVLDAVEYYGTLDGVKSSYPKLSIEQIKDAVSFAAAVTEHPVEYEATSPTR